MNTKTEELYTQLMAKFKEDCTAALQNAHDTLYGDMLPWAEDDTAGNIGCEARNIVSKIIAGEFVLEDSFIKVDGFSLGHINDYSYNSIVDSIAAVAGDAAKDAKIARLEQQIEDMMKGNY